MIKNAILIFVIVLLFLIFIPSFTRMQDQKARLAIYEKQIEILKERNAQLKEEKRLLEEDPVYLESVAREKLGIAREGEVVYKLKQMEEDNK